MAANEIHVGDITTKFLVTVTDDSVAEDISSATTKDIIFRKPDGTLLTKAGVFETDGTDGKLFYLTIADDLDTEGVWSLQVSLILSSGTWKSDVSEFTVYANL